MKVLKPETGQRPWVLPALVATIATVALLIRSFTGAGVDPEALAKQVDEAILTKNAVDARSALDRLENARKPTPADHVSRARVALLSEGNDEALAELAQVPDANPLAARARLLAGEVELRRNHPRIAEQFLRAAIKLDPSLVQAHRELIYIYGILLRRKELHDEFLALSRLVPLTSQNVYDWCLIRNVSWHAVELVPQLRTYVAADPADRWSRLALAENLRQLGRRDEADAVLAPLPATDDDALAIRVRLAIDRGDEAKADSLLAAGSADHPDLARLRGRLAMLRRDGPLAVTQFRASVRAEPDNRDGLIGLGQALTLSGDPIAAAPYLARARDLDAIGALIQRASTSAGRNDRTLARALGAACEKAGLFPEAVAWYHLAIDADPFDASAQKALFRLRVHDPRPAR